MISRKIGLHVIGGYAGSLGTPRVVKIVDPSVEAVRGLRAKVGPDCLIIVRWYEADQSVASAQGRAEAWFAKRANFMRALMNDKNILYESLNEVPDSQATDYCRFEVARMKLMQAEGFRSAVGNFSVGCPDIPVWKTYEPMLAQMRAGDLLGLHEYWADRSDLDNIWYCGRWRLVPRLANIPIVITECGRDKI